ncbi:Hypothetical predicted protein [Mytilus galloprovincialis]|uniref:Sulfotransferase domain-containing protein n=1 Tax=Mytilus galloprovincialis TaxID=29158 RepID=A0A8B6GXG8_MYTGA|nr:Hypothetical predicted protein [Mytilus galloprovincialis]
MTSLDDKFGIWPLIEYNGWRYFPLPSMVGDVGKRLQQMKDFNSRDDDVILASCYKAGTHWIHEITSMLLNQTTEYNTKHWTSLNLQLEWPEDYKFAEAMSEQRLLQSHLPFEFLPTAHINKGAKIIYVSRNPKDRDVSMYNFLHGKIGWPDMTWNEYFDKFVLNDDIYGGWFNHAKQYIDAIKHKKANICQVLYEDMWLDPIKHTTRLADFLEVPYDDTFIKEVVKKCSFHELKNKKIDITVTIHPEGKSTLFRKGNIHPEGKSTLFRKGKLGDWKNWFTVSQNEQFDALYRKEMKNVDVNFVFEPSGPI